MRSKLEKTQEPATLSPILCAGLEEQLTPFKARETFCNFSGALQMRLKMLGGYNGTRPQPCAPRNNPLPV